MRPYDSLLVAIRISSSSGALSLILILSTLIGRGSPGDNLLAYNVGGNAGKTAGKSEMAGTSEKDNGFKSERTPCRSVS